MHATAQKPKGKTLGPSDIFAPFVLVVAPLHEIFFIHVDVITVPAAQISSELGNKNSQVMQSGC